MANRRLSGGTRSTLGDMPAACLVIGALAALVGILIGEGWALRNPVLVRGGLDADGVVLASSLCCVLAGAGLLLAGHDRRTARWAGILAAALLTALAVGQLAESLFTLDPVFDLPSLHRWLDDTNPLPGRMSPVTSAAFAVCGLVLLMLQAGLTGRIALATLELLIFALIVFGIVDLLANWLDVEGLYGWQDTAPETVPSSVVLIGLGIGTWLRFHGPDAERVRVRREEWHLTIIAGEILAVIALVAGLTGFAILQQSSEAAFADALEDNLADRLRSFNGSIREAMVTNAMVAVRPVLARVVDRFNAVPDDEALAQLQSSAAALMRFGYRYVTYRNRAGDVVATAGDEPSRLDVTVRLNTGDAASLEWSERGFLLVQRLPMPLGDTVVGSVTVARYLPSLTVAYHNIAHIGTTADTRMCALRGDNGSCFPAALEPTIANRTSLSVAMTKALAGTQGRMQYRDYRGQHVVAAYGPIGTLGLGLVLKIDVAELYAPIRRELEIALPILLLLVAIGTLCLRTQITPFARRLRELATLDGLTGALNRRAFLRSAETELGVARRYGRPLTVMMLDADHFKKVNDVHGHDVGDAVLKALAATCRKELRDVDLFGRLGGEEFAVALPETPVGPARLVAERLRKALADLEIAAGKTTLRFTVSIGVCALARPSDTIEGLLKIADGALYASKQGGRNRVTVADAEAPATVAQTAGAA